MTVKERTRLIRNTTPNILEELFEMQNRICDLCEQPIQDIILAELEHSIPVSWFAKSDLSIKDAIKQANAPNNLRAAHYSCNGRKHDITRDEWFERGLNKTVGSPLIWSEGDLKIHQGRIIAKSRKGGKIGGKLGGPIGIRMMSREDHVRGGKNGRREDKVRAGLKAGKVSFEKKAGIHADGYDKSSGGRASAAVGHCARIAHLGGEKAVESGQILALARSGLGQHYRWHIKRNIFKPDCTFCVESKGTAYEGNHSLCIGHGNNGVDSR